MSPRLHPASAFTVATMPARIASGSVGHAWIIVVRSESNCGPFGGFGDESGDGDESAIRKSLSLQFVREDRP